MVDCFIVPLHTPNALPVAGAGLGTVRGLWKTVEIPTCDVSPECIATEGSSNLYWDQPVVIGWCQPARLGDMSFTPLTVLQPPGLDRVAVYPHRFLGFHMVNSENVISISKHGSITYIDGCLVLTQIIIGKMYLVFPNIDLIHTNYNQTVK